MSGRILQFGTSRFLQAHAALFAHEAREAGEDVGPIAVVQVSNSAERTGRVAAFGAPEGYPVILRGLEDGRPVDRRVTVRVVDRALSARDDWPALKALFAEEARFVLSNTGDRGYEVDARDRGPALLSGGVPISFPGKLAALLHARWLAGARPMTILPCELVSRNGDTLRRLVLDLAASADAPGLGEWIEREVAFANTLVDRIVSEPIEPVGAVAEPYALWAIERQDRLVLPFTHPRLVLADDLEPFERLKLHILNLGHTVLAERWLREGRAQGETVRAMLDEANMREDLLSLYRDEIVPGFASRGLGDEATDYVAATMERFENPFLDHRLADIAQNHGAKIERRIAAFLDWIEGRPNAPETPRLLALARAERRERSAR